MGNPGINRIVLNDPYYTITDLSALANTRRFRVTGGPHYEYEYKITLDGAISIATEGIQVGDVVKLILDTADLGSELQHQVIYARIGVIDGQDLYFHIPQITGNDFDVGAMIAFSSNSSAEFYRFTIPNVFIIDSDNTRTYNIGKVIPISY